MAGLLRSPLVLARSSIRASAVQVCAPALTRTFLVNTQHITKKSKLQQKQSQDQEQINAAAAASSSARTTQDSKYRIEKPSSAVFAFSNRLGLNELKDQTLVMRIVTHPSYERVGVQTNEGLDYLGGKALDMFVLEYLHTKYPKMPTSTLKEAVATYTRTSTLELMAKEFGVDDVARWVRSKPDQERQLESKTVKASIIRAMIGAIYSDLGPSKARDFVHAHFLSRDFNLVSLLPAHIQEEPKRYLSVLMKRLGRERPVARMMSETGRTSKAPVFIVGVYSGTEKIGEGFGSSLNMAETRANKDALTKYYMEELKDFGLPSDTEVQGAVYKPTKVGDSEIIV